MLTDFGNSETRTEIWYRARSGVTGTLDYVPPEAFKPNTKGKSQELSARVDIWALGLILHVLCFFKLPFKQSEDIDLLREEIVNYPGYVIPSFI